MLEQPGVYVCGLTVLAYYFQSYYKKVHVEINMNFFLLVTLLAMDIH